MKALTNFILNTILTTSFIGCLSEEYEINNIETVTIRSFESPDVFSYSANKLFGTDSVYIVPIIKEGHRLDTLYINKSYFNQEENKFLSEKIRGNYKLIKEKLPTSFTLIKEN
ncbi:hypothetical protein K9L67_05945 [Candidatus Woesearchaeota archaeon]|nr:hypothetical protein [Candidatus Woesearchaeota archaeon]